MTAIRPRATRMWPALAMVPLFAVAQILGAQAGTVAGTVVAEGTQRSLAGVQIGVVGVLGKGGTTDGSGRFTIADLPGTSVVLTFRFLGYRQRTDTVQVGRRDLRITMSERAFELNQLVVTGTAGGAQTKELGTSVATVNAANVLAQTAVPTFEGLLSGRAPGVTVIGTTGQVGARGADPRARCGILLALQYAARVHRRHPHRQREHGRRLALQRHQPRRDREHRSAEGARGRNALRY